MFDNSANKIFVWTPLNYEFIMSPYGPTYAILWKNVMLTDTWSVGHVDVSQPKNLSDPMHIKLQITDPFSVHNLDQNSEF